KPNGDGLLGRLCPVFAFTNVVNLFPNEFARLRRRRLAGALVGAGPLDGFFFWHDIPPFLPIGLPASTGLSPTWPTTPLSGMQLQVACRGISFTRYVKHRRISRGGVSEVAYGPTSL